MKIYFISDLHWGLSNKVQNVLEENFKSFYLSLEKYSKLIICGDIFDKVNIRFDYIYDLFDIINLRNDVDIIAIYGNHDLGAIYSGDDLDFKYKNTLDFIMRYANNKIHVVDNFESMQFDNVIIDFVSYNYNNDMKINRKIDWKDKTIKKILVYHGLSEDEITDYSYNNQDFIGIDITSKYDYVFKGHIHQDYQIGNVYSTGPLLNFKDGNTNCYYVIDSITGEKLYNKYKEKQIKYYNRIYLNDKNVNNFIKNIDKYSNVSCVYKGDINVIDQDEYTRASNEAINFRFIFDDSFTNEENVEFSEDNFMSFNEYLENSLKHKENSNIKDILSKYNISS